MWAKLPPGTDLAILSVVGGECLRDTLKLCQVNSCFLELAKATARQHLEDDSASVRMEALKANVRMGEQGSLMARKTLLARTLDQDASIRELAVRTLSYLLVAGDEDALLAISAGIRLLDDDDSAVRQAARSLLSAVAGRGNSSVVAALVASASSMDEERRVEAVEALAALAQRGDGEALAALKICMEDASLRVRQEAVAALGDVAEYGDETCTELLCQASSEPDPTMRCALAHASTAIAARGSLSMIRALLSFLLDSHAEVRVRAVTALGVIAEPGHEETIAALSALESDPDSRVHNARDNVLEMLKSTLDIPMDAAADDECALEEAIAKGVRHRLMSADASPRRSRSPRLEREAPIFRRQVTC
mmetsp:Transcript_95426/g.169410  ORF Transcript_95426/g.169410 Transcript_95426/m.169410 type:complete len:365 (+) Transcript_95426:115-1209(+)